VSRVRDYLLRYADRPMVRPLALAGPVLVLLIALPLLRPLRHPAAYQTSDDEALRLATIRALVEHRSLHLPAGYKGEPGTIQRPHGVYSAQPPMMSLLLSVPAWAMTRMGLSFEENELLIAYLLTLLGVTLPVAATAGLIYRMARLFELRRPLRALLGLAVVLGSGLISYAVVLNPHAPAAVLVMASAACLIHVAAMHRDDRRAGWFALAGACSALASTIDPAAAVLMLLLICVIPAMRIPLGRRLAGVMLYVIGAVPVIAMHAAWNIPVAGGILPPAPTPVPQIAAKVVPVASPAPFDFGDDEAPPSPGIWQAIGSNVRWLVHATIGDHGLYSHFPVMLMGIFGIGVVMHRNWPSATKTLAAAAGVGALIIFGLHWGAQSDFSSAMFANRFFLVFSPLLLFWAGAWLRRGHKLSSWLGAAVLAVFSIAVGLIGATNPTPPQGFDGYTLVENATRLLNPDAAASVGALAGREP
jgi:hypothetical protein